MAHMFIDKGKQTTFVSKKEIPWHSLGKIVDAMTSKEAIVLGGLDFDVQKIPLWINNINPTPFDTGKVHDNLMRVKESLNNPHYYESKQLTDNFCMIRTDTQHPFGIVGSRYEPIQNTEAFDFFDSIIGEGHAQYETVGALGNGEIVFITAKLPNYFEVAKDKIEQYLLLTMSHDGSGSIIIMFTPIRVVCNNTLSLALKGSKNKVIIKHTKNARERLEISKATLGLIDNQVQNLSYLFSKWEKETISDKLSKEIIIEALGLKPKLVTEDKEEFSTRANSIIKSVTEYYNTGVGQEGIVGTKWGLYNGITGYFQNQKEYKNDTAKFQNTFSNGDSYTRQNVADILMKI